MKTAFDINEIPFSLPDIELGRFVDYYEKHGREMDHKLHEILKSKPPIACNEIEAEDFEFSKELSLDSHLDEEALSWIGYWSGLESEKLKEVPNIVNLLNRYRSFRTMLYEGFFDSKEGMFEAVWEGDVWSIQDYKVTPSSDMDFNEVITSKEIIRQINSVQKGRWDALPYICAVFFRKKGEKFSDRLIAADGNRIKLMEKLPLAYAVSVAFFLKNYANTWNSTSVYLARKAGDPLRLN